MKVLFHENSGFHHVSDAAGRGECRKSGACQAGIGCWDKIFI
jgi:hypothetical protein